MKKSNRKISAINVIFITFFCIILTVYTIAICCILLWGVLTSLKSNVDFQFMDNVLGLPNLEKSRKEFLELANYKLVLENFQFTRKISFYSGGRLINHETKNGILQMLINTLLYAGIGSALHCLVPATTAFLCVKYKEFKLSKIVYAANLVTMTLPLIGTAPAMIEMMRTLNIYDSFVGTTLQKCSFTGMYFLVLYAFYEGLSDSYQEAAEIDGASYYSIFFKIILPLSATVLSTTFLLNFVNLWNDYQSPLLYLPTHPTLAYGVYYMSTVSSGQLSKVPARVAGCMLLAIPIFIIFIFMRKRMMGNISIGGVKE